MSKRSNGEGTIYKSESKKCWVAQMSFFDEQTGKTKRKTVYGKTQKEAKEKLKLMYEKIHPNEETITLYKIILDQIEHEFDTNILKEGSYIRKKETLKIISNFPFSQVPIKSIKSDQIKDFLAGVTTYSDSVISKAYQLVNSGFKTAIAMQYISFNPLDNKMLFKKPKSQKTTKKVSALTIQDQKKLIEVLQQNPNILYKEQFLISMFTGARMGEINALNVEDINFSEKTISITKTVTRDINNISVIGTSAKTRAGTRVLHIPEMIIKMLKNYLEENKILTGRIFSSKSGTIISTNQVNSEFKRICKKHGQAYPIQYNGLHMYVLTYADSLQSLL